MSAVYWAGGDESVERTIYRPQFFDRIVAWGGGPGDPERHQVPRPGHPARLVRPEVVDLAGRTRGVRLRRDRWPTSPSGSPPTPRSSTRKRASPAGSCSSRAIASRSRGSAPTLAERLAVDRDFASAEAPPLPADTRNEIEVMARPWATSSSSGSFDGSGLVVLSDRPVDFHPTNKTSNVVMVPSLDDAMRYVNVATQTIGVYPWERKTELARPPGQCRWSTGLPRRHREHARAGRPARRDVRPPAVRPLDERRRHRGLSRASIGPRQPMMSLPASICPAESPS